MTTNARLERRTSGLLSPMVNGKLMESATTYDPPPSPPSVCKWTVVSMDEVPEPPPQQGDGGRFGLLYEALLTLPLGHSIKIPMEGGKAGLAKMKSALHGKAKRDGKRVLSSRTADNTMAWLWLTAAKKKPIA